MAYRMIALTDRVRVGINNKGEANIEVWTPRHDARDATMEEIFVPADALEDVAKFLLKNG
jgi:hypothetical protein